MRVSKVFEEIKKKKFIVQYMDMYRAEAVCAGQTGPEDGNKIHTFAVRKIGNRWWFFD